MSTEVYDPKLVDGVFRPLHLMLPGVYKCTNCGASKYAMRTYYTSSADVWARVFKAPEFLLSNQGEAYIFKVCIGDIKGRELSAIPLS